MTLNQAIKTLNIEGRRLTVPSVRKLTGIKSDAVIRAALDKFKADLRRKEKEEEEKSQMNVKYAEIVVRWRKSRTWGSTCTAEAKVETENGEWHYFTSPRRERLRLRQAFAGSFLCLQCLLQGHDLATDPGKGPATGGEDGAILHLARQRQMDGHPSCLLHRRLWPILAGRHRHGALYGSRGVFGR